MKNFLKLIIIFVLSLNLYSSESLEEVSIQLDWKYQFEHAGFIVAKEKGFYKEAGLDVTLLEYSDGVDIQKDVISKKVDFGISNAPLMIKNNILQPVVVLATYLQRSPLVLVTQPEIKKPSELEGKKIMVTEEEYRSSSLSLLLEHFFIKSIHVPHTYGIEAFKNKEIDAMSAFTSNELYELDKQNIPYNVMDPLQYGFVTNAINLFTSLEVAKNKTQMTINLLAATKKGWEYALKNTDEAVKIIHKYNQKKSLSSLRYEAKEIKNLMLLSLYDIGETSKELLIRAYKQLVRSNRAFSHQEDKIKTFGDILKNRVNTNIIFSKKEKAYLEKKGILKLCVDPDWMPFEGIREGQYVGMIADYFELIRKKSGLKIEVYPTKNWDESISAMKSRKCDIIGSATPTTDRLSYMNFTDVYMKFPIVLATKVDKPFIDDMGDIVTKTFGASKGNSIIEILKDKYPKINIVEVENIQDGLRKVERGKIYGYLDNLSVTVTNIQQSFHGVLKVSARLKESDDLTIASRNDEPLLNSIFQKIIYSIDQIKVRKILNNWIAVEESGRVDYTFVGEIILVGLLLLIIISFYSYKLKVQNRKLAQVSREDALTKIGNRLKINEVLAEEYRYTRRYEVPCGIILLDIDNFKEINDKYGHLKGDDILQKFAVILSQNIRATDKLGRWGGEEFLIVCPNTKREDLLKVVEGLRKDIENYDFGDGVSKITASFGISSFDGVKTIDKVVDEADRGLYHAKSSGKNKLGIIE
ncbi:diguanylate cyclase [Sulfurospirillum arcachonense]|uniref:diguanylate cyclase n=1 Tax=Sulfurospirillum arcachonense TaxID=57666 RepID=UPI000468F898|nr:diguanylate cyclase [Sulfurospirillum arcachonense]